MKLEQEIRLALNLKEGDKVEFRKITKKELDGCIITKMSDGFGVVIYYDKSKSDKDIVKYITETYKNNPSRTNVANNLQKILSDKAALLSNVYPMIVNRNNNLSDMPHKPWLNLEIIYYIDLGEGIVKLHNQYLEAVSLSLDELHNAAMTNLKKRKPQIKNITEMLGLPSTDKIPIWVITSESSVYGAVYILLPEIFKDVERKLGNEFCILPSSIHEVLCVPNTGGLLDMVKSVNATELSKEDYLADSVYNYNNGKITESIA